MTLKSTTKQDRKARARMEALLKIESFKEHLEKIRLSDGFVEGMDCPADDCDDTVKKMTLDWSVLEDGMMQHRSVDILACECGFRIRPPTKEVRN